MVARDGHAAIAPSDTDTDAFSPDYQATELQRPPWKRRALAGIATTASLVAAAATQLSSRSSSAAASRDVSVASLEEEGMDVGPLFEFKHRVGCRNWATLQIGQAQLVSSPTDCANRCMKLAHCEAFNFQFGGELSGCHLAKEARQVGKSWCYMFRGGCDQGVDKCNDLYTFQSNYVAAYVGVVNETGCKNWKSIQKDKTTREHSIEECGDRCYRTSGCKGFNYQQDKCPGSEQVAKGSCMLFEGVCTPEPTKCWDLYAMDGMDILPASTESVTTTSGQQPQEPTTTSSSGSASGGGTSSTSKGSSTSSTGSTTHELGNHPSQTTTLAPTSAPKPTDTPTAAPPTPEPAKEGAPHDSHHTFTLPDSIMNANASVQQQVMTDLAEMLANMTGAHVELKPVASSSRRLASASNVMEATFSPGSNKLDEQLNQELDTIQSAIDDQVKESLEAAGVPTEPPADDKKNNDNSNDGTDRLMYIIIGVVGVIMLGACVGAYAFLHSSKQNKRKGAASAREGLRKAESAPQEKVGFLHPEPQETFQLQPEPAQPAPPQEQVSHPPAGVAPVPVIQQMHPEGETHITEARSAGSTELSVVSTNGFAQGDRIQISSGGGHSETKVISGLPSSTSILVHTGVFYAHPQGTTVSKVQTFSAAPMFSVSEGAKSERDAAPSESVSASGCAQDVTLPEDLTNFTVDLEHDQADRYGSRPVGLRVVPVDEAEESGLLLVGCVLDGSRASDWNAQFRSHSNRHKQIRRGDRIESVNGIRGSLRDRIDELDKPGTLRIEVSRADNRLEVFTADKDDYCDQCGIFIPQGTKIWWCEESDWWICNECCPMTAATATRKFRSPQGMVNRLVVNVIEASNLRMSEKSTKWVVVEVDGMKTARKTPTQTSACQDCLDPKWKDQVFEYTNGRAVGGVDFKVYHNLNGKEEMLGRAKLLPVNFSPNGDAGEQDLPLTDLAQGVAEGATIKMHAQIIYRWSGGK